MSSAPRREVHTADALAWIGSSALPDDHAIVTSLPDSSELGRMDLPTWRSWFVDVAQLLCEKAAPDALVVFYQTDVKLDGRWVDKGHLVHSGADRAGSSCLFHKVICRAPAGTTTFGRPAFAHILGFSRELVWPPARASADVIPSLGEMTWPRAMGLSACSAIAKLLVAHTKTRVVVDPFCGVGTMLAAANAFGLDAIGVELSPKRARRASELELLRQGDALAIPPSERRSRRVRPSIPI